MVSMDGPTCSMDPWIGSDIGVCLSGVDRNKWCPWMVLPVPWIHGLDRTLGYACLVWTGISGVHGWSYLFHGSMDWIGHWGMPVWCGQE